MDAAGLGVVIPAIDEEATLPALLADLHRLRPPPQIVVVDGGSRDRTVTVARAGGAIVLRADPGRSRQMNAGARFLHSSPWLLLLHADSRLEDPALRAIEGHMSSSSRAAACLELAIDHPSFYYRLIERGQQIRVRRTGLVYGDQGLLIPRELFFEVGPYPNEPVLEDVILARRLQSANRLHHLDARITTSARRYEEEGRIRGFVRNAWLIARFLRGATPTELAHRYPVRRARVTIRRKTGQIRSGERGKGDRSPAVKVERPERRMVLVFAKDPQPGRVKTRLAETIGTDAATTIYRRMGRLVVNQLRGLDATLTICHDPPEAAARVRNWLGDLPTHLWPQPPGDLGARLAATFARAFRHADQVVAIGTDALAVDRARIELAFAALATADVVVGPATDGGYYLLGLDRPRPELFAGVRWSTSQAFGDTVRRAEAMGARITFLPPESDLDRASDLTPEVRARLGEFCRVRAGKEGSPNRAERNEI